MKLLSLSEEPVVTVGQIITEAIRLHELNPGSVEKELDLPKDTICKLMYDEEYINNIPLLLFKNLILSLHIPFVKIEKAMLPTFQLIKSKEAQESLKKKPQGHLLWENEEAVIKYTDRLKELMKGTKSKESVPK
jgi:hypothetical protein